MKLFKALMVVFFALVVVWALTGCVTTQPTPRIQTVEVKVAVPVECKALSDLGVTPEFPDTTDALSSAPDLFERVKLLVQGRLLRIARLAQFEAAKASC
jgi:hypothetical protein